MSTGRLSLENIEHGKNVDAARALEAQMSKANLQLVNRVAELNAHRTNEDGEFEEDDGKSRDPAIVAQELSDQIVRRSMVRDGDDTNTPPDILAQAQVSIPGAKCQGQIREVHSERHRRCAYCHRRREQRARAAQ